MDVVACLMLIWFENQDIIMSQFSYVLISIKHFFKRKKK
jgi:hypothetical protein